MQCIVGYHDATRSILQQLSFVVRTERSCIAILWLHGNISCQIIGELKTYRGKVASPGRHIYGIISWKLWTPINLNSTTMQCIVGYHDARRSILQQLSFVVRSERRGAVSENKACNESLDKKLTALASWTLTALRLVNKVQIQLGFVNQANGRLSFEDDLSSGGLLYWVSQWTSVRTELADKKAIHGTWYT